jgi:hypothetical protein
MINEKNNISFKSIDSILINLCSYYNIIKKQYELNLLGGKNKDFIDSKNKDSNNQKKYYKKYKNLIKSSAKSINYYKNMIQLQMSKQIKLNNYYGNLIGTLKLQRDNLASGFQILENDFKNKKEKINMLETMINGLEKYIQSSKTITIDIDKIRHKSLVGGMMYDDFHNQVNKDMEELNQHISSINDDKKFLENKIENLHARMKNIVIDNDILFQIKTEVEWMVNQLENSNDGDGEKVIQQDFDELYKKIKLMIDTAKSKKADINDNTAEYVHELEKYAQTLQTFIESQKVINKSIANDKKSLITDILKNKTAVETALKDKLTDTQAGGTFKEKYNEKKYIMINKLKQKFEKNFTHIVIIKPDNLLNDNDNDNFSEIFGKMVNIVNLIIKLDIMLVNLNNVYKFLIKTPNIFKYDEKTNNFISHWKKIFEKKKTDFYNNLLTYKIYYDKKIITFEEALKNLKICEIEIDITNDINNINDIITHLNNTIICMDHIFFLIINLILIILLINKDKDKDKDNKTIYDDSINLIQIIIENKKDNLTKSALLSYNDFYSHLYDSQNGGSLILIFPNTPLEQIQDEEIPNYLQLFVAFTTINTTKSDKNPLKLTSEIQIDKTIELTKSMNSLYEKILKKLDINDDEITSASDDRIMTIEDLIKLFGKTTNIQQEAPSPAESTISRSQVTSKPRLDIYKLNLINCKNNLKPYMKNISILKKVLNSIKTKGEFIISETLNLFKLYNDVKSQIDIGTNSYIKLIPMIFFTIEFPPSIYATDPCRFQLTFNSKEQEVEYKFITGLNRNACNDVGLGEFKEDDFKTKKFNSHAGFFESNKSNGTKKLIEDPVIGLAKLIEQDIDKNKPINCTINMMFALGPSGVGKSTRFFGKINGDADDREGIIPFIINKSLSDNPSLTKKISIAYFVCYGQKTEINNDNNSDFNELVIFFNINEIDNNTGNNDLKYIPYYMPKSSIITQEQVNKYTQFYSNVVSKKLKKDTFTKLEGFISKGASFPSPSNLTSEDKTFREILESPTEIWKEIKHKDNDKIGEIFENLIIEQKKINTILATKNNIESSRGHTCIVIKIEDDSEQINKIKYFPLFDMAGTENTKQMKDFLITGRNTINMAKLIQKVNEFTQKNDIIKSDDNNKQYPSLKDLLDYNDISTYVKSDARGGAKNKITDADFIQQLNDPNDKSPSLGENFLNKIVKEGYYINHTIYTLIFAAMCVGYSLKTEKIGEEDKFDDFIDTVFQELITITCIPSKGNSCENKSMMLLKENNSAAIVNSSCIWLQILFSFLYWNEETLGSIKEKIETLSKDTEYVNYLYDPKVQDIEFIPGLLTVKKLLELGNREYELELEVLKKIWTIMKDVNDNENFNTERKLTSPVTIVSVNNKKLYIEREELKGNQQPKTIDYTKTIDKNTYVITVDNELIRTHRSKISDYKNAIYKCLNFVSNVEIKFNQQIIQEAFIVDGKKSQPNPSNPSNPSYDADFKSNLDIIFSALKAMKPNITIDKKPYNIDYNKVTFSKKLTFEIVKNFKIYIDIIMENMKLDTPDPQKKITSDKIIDTLESISSFELPNIVKLLETTNSKLKMNSEMNSFTIIKDIQDKDEKIEKIEKIEQTLQDVVDKLSKIPSIKIPNVIPDVILNNQMNRIKDGSCTATKMTLMHVTTGQGLKNNMANDVFELVRTLFGATDTNFKEK